jgi:hypothetical protein
MAFLSGDFKFTGPLQGFSVYKRKDIDKYVVAKKADLYKILHRLLLEVFSCRESILCNRACHQQVAEKGGQGLPFFQLADFKRVI